MRRGARVAGSREPGPVRARDIGLAVVLALSATGCSYGELNVRGPCDGWSTLTDRPPVDEADYQIANREVLSTIPMPAGASVAEELDHPYSRCADGRGDVVGVRTSARVALPAPSTVCAVSPAVEEPLRAAGWTGRALETTDADGVGTVRVAELWLSAVALTVSIGDEPTEYMVTVDHDAVSADVAGDPVMQCQALAAAPS
jgi:hypothetical protein